jgi:penicillin-binding protein 1C
MKLRKKLSIIVSALGVASASLWLLSVFWDLPSVDRISQAVSPPSIRITDRHDRLLYDVLPAESGRHMDLPADAIPDCVKNATIAVEDSSFYQNPGVDPAGILRALWINLQGGETIAGGSTITQQVVRNLLLSPSERTERTLRRKLREMWLAGQLPQRYSKDEILALYLNQTYYGGMAYGIEAASQTYFGKPAAGLLLPECALLAGLPQAPALYDPYTHPDLAQKRQRIVLGLMEQSGYITALQRQQAEEFPLAYNPAPYPILAPHFVWMVTAQLEDLYAKGSLDPREAMIVRTTLNLDDQRIAEDTISRNLALFRNPDSVLNRNVNNAAMVVMDPHSGEILALVGSADFFDESIHGAINMAAARRQPGSAFKPFIYAVALDPAQESPWTAATAILDVSTTFLDTQGKPYTPEDYDGQDHGPLPVRKTLASSLNIPAVIALDHVGIPSVVSLAGRLDIISLRDQDPGDLSLALGGGEMSLLELTSAYATLADEGKYAAQSLLLDVHDVGGRVLYQPEKQPPPQVIDPRVAWLISDILSDDSARSIGFGTNSTLKIDRTAAVKTGTTTNYHDNWTIGYTPDLVVGVWVGNAGYEPMRDVTGLTGAAPIWNQTMRELLRGLPDTPFARPAGLMQQDVCDLTGLLPGPACPHIYAEWFIEGTQPVRQETLFQTVWVDSATGHRAEESTPSDRRTPLTVWNLPLTAVPWARLHGLPLLLDYAAQGKAGPEGNPITLILPVPNSEYRWAEGFDSSAQQLPVEAVVGQGMGQVSLWADGIQLMEFSAPPYRAWWPLAPGAHAFHAEALDADGRRVVSATVTIIVRRGSD